MGRIILKLAFCICLMLHLGALSGCALIKERQETQQLEKQVKDIQTKKAEYVKAEKLYRQGEFVKAKALFAGLIDAYPDFLPAHYRLGNLAFREGDLAVAANHFEFVVKRAPKHAKAHYNLAIIRILQSENNLKNYAATADASIDLNPILIFLQDIDHFSNSLQSKQIKLQPVDNESGLAIEEQ